MPGFSDAVPHDVCGVPIYEGDLVQVGKRMAFVIVTLEDKAMLIEYDKASLRPNSTWEQGWLYPPFDCIVRAGALSPIK
jgi:hypothetical protein